MKQPFQFSLQKNCGKLDYTMPCMKTELPVSHCKVICKFLSPMTSVVAQQNGATHWTNVPHQTDALSRFGRWHREQQGGKEKLPCPQVTCSVVGSDCGLRPDGIFLTYGYWFLMFTEKLHFFTLPGQAVLLKVLRHRLYKSLLFSYI